jgi:hypothetical protein
VAVPLIENLTNWKTEDLTAYFEEADRILGSGKRPVVVKVVHWRGSDLVCECTFDRSTGVGTLKLPRPKRFETNVIDMLAATLQDGGTGQLPPDFRNHVAASVQRVMERAWGRSPGYGRKAPKVTWGANLPLRIQKKRRRTAPESLRREIESLEIVRDNLRKEYESHLRQMEMEIAAKRARLTEAEGGAA